jgi:hypothetical protein
MSSLRPALVDLWYDPIGARRPAPISVPTRAGLKWSSVPPSPSSIMTDAIAFSPSRVVPLAVLLLWQAPAAPAAVTTGTDEEAQLPYWEVTEPGISIRLVQRLPDQTRGYFQARGFSTVDSDHIAQNCVFQTIFRNVTVDSKPGVIDYDLREWTVHAAGARRVLKTREDWKAEWNARKVPMPAQLAFEWSLLPTRQSYGPGDYNWGMTAFGLAPGAVFDLDVVWYQRGERHSVRVNGVRCAPDIHPEPSAQ